ncbi:DUF58 domain-containing protein [soil metagenome]
MTAITLAPWRPTHAHLRTSAVGLGGTIAAVLGGRPDLLALVTPFAAVAIWSILTRPRVAPSADVHLGPTSIREGETTTWTASISGGPGTEHVVALVPGQPHWHFSPRDGVATGAWHAGHQNGADVAEPSISPVDLVVTIRSMRWGRRPVGPVLIGATSSWGAFRSGPVSAPTRTLSTVPRPATFDTGAAVPRPTGLVGLHRSPVRGDGTEFAAIRPFVVGDRQRRIHWPVSLRTGVLHVNATHADRDSDITLVIDAGSDIGPSGGIDGPANSLDLTVRGAGAVAEHFLHRGDRVGLTILGASRPARVPAAAGIHHLRRVLDELAGIFVAVRGAVLDERQLGPRSRGLMVLFSPVMSPDAPSLAVSLIRRHRTVLVVDTLPPDLARTAADGPAAADPSTPAALAWRIRQLERRRELRLVQAAGVPIVAWRGEGSLEHVLRDLARRVSPRPARR